MFEPIKFKIINDLFLFAPTILTLLRFSNKNIYRNALQFSKK